jgi:hypothetical protein
LAVSASAAILAKETSPAALHRTLAHHVRSFSQTPVIAGPV